MTDGANDVRDAIGSLLGVTPSAGADAAVAFAVRIALYAQRVDHHPDLLIQWGKVTVTWTTHDAGGVTGRDVELARFMDAAVP